MSEEPSAPLPIAMVRMLALGVSRLGLDSARFLASAGVPAGARDGVVPDIAVARALFDLARENGIEHMGLEMGQCMSLGWFGTIDYVFSTSATLADALASIRPELASLAHGVRWEFAIQGAQASLRALHTIDWPGAEAMIAMMREFNIAVMVRRIRDVLGDEAVHLDAVRFSHPAPASTAVHERFFRVPVEFGTKAGLDEVVVPMSLFGARLLTADPILAQTLRDRALGPRQDESADPFIDRVRSVIQGSLKDGDTALGVDVIAAQLDLSARALQRRLKERNLSVSGLIDEQRRAVAETLLSRESVLLCDVAYELGFHDVKAFFRAFRRWTGTSPRAFQKAKGAQA